MKLQCDTCREKWTNPRLEGKLCVMCGRGTIRRVSSYKSGRCGTCGGSGRWVKDPHYPPVICPQCKGTGVG